MTNLQRRKGLFCGSGLDAVSNIQVVKEILSLAKQNRDGKVKERFRVAFFGTATYDALEPKEKQTALLKEEGCIIDYIDIALAEKSNFDLEKAKSTIESCDIILVSGGNTLYAIDKIKEFGLDVIIRSKHEDGVVLAGGSAGAIIWFDAGHSDSGDPATFKKNSIGKQEVNDNDEAKKWDYIRVSCLGFYSGLVCPHLDKIQSNGVLRALDFENMMLRHPNEIGIGIDHWACLKISGEKYEIIAVDGKPGSVLNNGEFSESQNGKPGVWIYNVVGEEGGENKVLRSLAPIKGLVSDITQPVKGHFIVDERERLIREQNV